VRLPSIGPGAMAGKLVAGEGGVVVLRVVGNGPGDAGGRLPGDGGGTAVAGEGGGADGTGATDGLIPGEGGGAAVIGADAPESPGDGGETEAGPNEIPEPDDDPPNPNPCARSGRSGAARSGAGLPQHATATNHAQPRPALMLPPSSCDPPHARSIVAPAPPSAQPPTPSGQPLPRLIFDPLAPPIATPGPDRPVSRSRPHGVFAHARAELPRKSTWVGNSRNSRGAVVGCLDGAAMRGGLLSRRCGGGRLRGRRLRAGC
jgi:hypothetical protein